MKKLCLAMLFILTACGGNSHDNSGSGSGGSAGTPDEAVSTFDAFVTRVLEIVGASAEDTEPVATDTLTETTPEDTAPGAVK